MEPLNLPTSKDNPADRSAGQIDAAPLSRSALATGLAQAVFGAAYSPPAHAGFVDRTPAEITAIRATMGVGAAR